MKAPINLDNSLSKNACMRIFMGPLTFSAEIWRKGANKVFSNKSKENKSYARARLSRTRAAHASQPDLYHQDTNPIKNITNYIVT